MKYETRRRIDNLVELVVVLFLLAIVLGSIFLPMVICLGDDHAHESFWVCVNPDAYPELLR